MHSTEDIVFNIMMGAVISMAIFSFVNEYENLFICRLKALLKFYKDERIDFNDREIYKYRCQIKYYNSKIESLNLIPYLNVLLTIVFLTIIIFYLAKLLLCFYRSKKEIKF